MSSAPSREATTRPRRDDRLPLGHSGDPLGSPGSLSGRATEILRSEANVFISAASLWEVETKRQIGKLTLEVDLERHLLDHGFLELPITGAHARQVGLLPLLHRDPFDRMLAAQALAENLTLVTADRELARYPIRTLF